MNEVDGMALGGLRICSFEVAWAAPHCSRLLADMGAEVIQIESASRIDLTRYLGAYPEGEFGLNRAGGWNSLHRNKLSVTLDLKKREAVELAKEIVNRSDVVLNNYAPRVMKNFGLDYASLKEVRPDVVYLSLSGYGQTGPEKDYVAVAATISCISGMASATGYAVDGLPRPLGNCTADVVAGTHAAFAILAALHHRARTGEGQEIDISMWESNMAFIPETIMDYVFNGVAREPAGNRDEWMAPHGYYRCKGEDKWVGVAIRTDEEWQRLCRVMEAPDLAGDERFRDVLGRWHRQDELAAIVEHWTVSHTPSEVVEALQRVGIAAGCCLNTEELLRDRHLRERGYYVEVDHPETGIRQVDGSGWKLSRTPARVYRHAPLLGEHNMYVFKELLGFDEERIRGLMEAKVIY